jgi:hypothetical protein
MKYLLFVFLLVIKVNPGHAQSYHHVDSLVGKYPKAFWPPEKLAKRISIDFHSDSAKARAIFTWMAKHIAYDVQKYKLIKARKYSDPLTNQIKPFNLATYHRKCALRTLRKKKGVCGDYAILYDRLCELTGVPSEVIEGIAKNQPQDIGKMPFGVDHGWNAVKINNTWRLLDVTWGAGGVDDNGNFIRRFKPQYFFTPPDLFFLNHFPRASKWLLTDKNDSTFALLPLYHQLTREIEFISPAVGVINNKSKYGIQFVIRASDHVLITYRYNRSNTSFAEYMETTATDGLVSFIVPPPSHGDDFLTIYCNGKALATFKVKSKRFIRTPFASHLIRT